MTDTVRTLSALQTLLADNTSGDISPQDARDVLVSSWTPGWVQYLDHRLSDETPHTDDDFFQTDSSADYTDDAVSGTATWQITRGVLSVRYTSQSGGNAATFIKPITSASAPMTIETRLSVASLKVNWPTAALVFADGTSASSKTIEFGTTGNNDLSNAALQLRKGTRTDIQASNYNRLVSIWACDYLTYIRLIWKSANTWQAAASVDGISWWSKGFADVSYTMTPTHFGFLVTSYGDTNDHGAAFDYFRVYDSDLSV